MLTMATIEHIAKTHSLSAERDMQGRTRVPLRHAGELQGVFEDVREAPAFPPGHPKQHRGWSAGRGVPPACVLPHPSREEGRMTTEYVLYFRR